MKRSTIQTLGAALLAVSAVALPGAALANGRFPASTGINADTADQQRLLVRATFGLLLSRDGGSSFRWLCEAAVGYRPGTFDPPVVAAGDRLLIGSPTGLFRSTDFGCNWTPVEELLPYQVTDLAADPTDAEAVFASTAISDRDNGVFLSRNGGQTFSPVLSRGCNTFFLSVKVAPSDRQRLYASAYQDLETVDGGAGDAGPSDCPTATPGGPNFNAFVYTSINGGKSWDQLPFTYQDQKVVAVLAVSPTEPRTLFARVRSYEPKRDTLLISRDAGATFTKILEVETLAGFIVEPDGKTLWASSELEGVYRSTDTGATFDKLTNAPHAACLGAGRGKGEIYLCGQNFTDGAALFRTLDGGKTFSEVFRFDQMCGTLSCPSDSATGSFCPALYTALAQQLAIDLQQTCQPAQPDGGTDAGPSDAGPSTDRGTGGGGGSCAMPGSAATPSAGSVPGAGLILLVLVALGLAGSNRRRPRR